MAEKVEGYKLSPEQVKFGKSYKVLMKIQKALLMNLRGTMTEAKTLRDQLGEVEGMLGGLVQQAPPPFLNELEGQERPTMEENLQ